MDYFIYCVLVTLPIYTDSPLGLVLGVAGYSILTTLSLIMMAAYILRHKRIVLFQLEKKFFFQITLMIIGSIVGIVAWVISSGSIIEHGENLIIKSFKIILYYASYPSYLFLLSGYMRKIELDKAVRPIFIILIVLAVLSIVEYQLIPYAFAGIHFTSSIPYERVRLLTQESSHTATMILIYFAISLFYSIYKNRFLYFGISIVCAAILIGTTTSKGLMASLLIFLLIGIFNVLRSKRRSKLFYVALLVVALAIANSFVTPLFLRLVKSDLRYYTSVASRIYTFVIALFTGIIHPLGVGGAFLGFFPHYMEKFLRIYQALPMGFNTMEIQRVINNSTDFAVATSSGFMQLHMYWGIVGSILFFKTLFKEIENINRIKVKGKSILQSAYWVLILMIAFTLPFAYDFILFVSFANYIVTNYKQGRIC